MLYLAALFAVLAIAAALFGFSGVAEDLVSIAWLAAIVFVVLFVIAAAVNLVNGRKTPAP